MTTQSIIDKTIAAISKLPPEKASEIADFADYILKKYDDEILQQGIQKLVIESKAFDFLKTEEDIYTTKDLKEKYK